MALERLAPLMTDADTSRNLRWQHDAAGDPCTGEFSRPKAKKKGLVPRTQEK
jgi:hypothetical protein